MGDFSGLTEPERLLSKMLAATKPMTAELEDDDTHPLAISRSDWPATHSALYQ